MLNKHLFIMTITDLRTKIFDKLDNVYKLTQKILSSKIQL